MEYKSCCFSGHRCIDEEDKRLIIANLEKAIEYLVLTENVRDFYCGGALGFDTMAEIAVLKAKSYYPEIKLNLILPHKNQHIRWSNYSKILYNNILEKADEVYYLSEKYTNTCMLQRNKMLVDKSDFCVFYLKRFKGGTYNTYKYCVKEKIDINLIDILDFETIEILK